VSLELTDAQRETLKQFRADGLLWMVNAAILHPRGYALTAHIDDAGEPIGLSVLGDGVEPWCFADASDVQDAIRLFMDAEVRRESIIAPALGKGEA